MPYKNREVALRKHREYWNKHKTRLNKRRNREYKKDSTRFKRSANKCYRKKTGWTEDLYNQRLIEQNSLCAICGNPQEGKELAADHRHSDPPKPRGLLCELCNRALGLFKDRPDILRKAAEYIEKYE